MNTKLISAQDPFALQRALEVLRLGGLVAFPTDTVYGLGAMAFNRTAVENIYSVKGRPAEKAIPVLIGDAEDLAKVSAEIPEIAQRLAARFWPGPLTLVVPKHPDLSTAVSATATIGVRIPNHPVARALLLQTGPMAVSSANISGQPNPLSAQEVFDQLGGRIALIIDGGKTPGGVASTVVDCVGTELKVLRAGPISEREILEVSRN